MTLPPDNAPDPEFDRLMSALERERLRYKERGPAQSRALWMRLLLLVFLVLVTVALWGVSVWLEREAKALRADEARAHPAFCEKSLCSAPALFLDSPLPRHGA